MVQFLDFFAGFGGASSGLVEAGFELVTAYNHWERAIEVHSANHTEADHVQGDLSGYDMRRLPYAPVLWASPECTWHSPAGGRKRVQTSGPTLFGDDPLPADAGVRSRATMFDPIRAAEARNFDVVIIENVVEVARWPLFESWLKMWEALDYSWQVVNVNAAHVYSEKNAPAGQWRDRIYVVLTRKGVTPPNLNPSPPAYCGQCDRTVSTRQHWKKPAPDGAPRFGKYGPQYVYVCDAGAHALQVVEPYVLPAAAVIDWSDLGVRIGDRGKQGLRPLAAATLRRIEVGLRMFARPTVVGAAGQTWDAANPRHPKFGGDGYYRAWDSLDPLNVRQAGGSGDGVAVPPFAMAVNHDGAGRQFGFNDQPWPTRSTKIGDGMVFPPYVAELYGTSTARGVEHQALSTVTAGGGHHGLAVPPDAFLSRQYGQRGSEAHLNSSVAAPMYTVTATGGNHALVVPERKRPADRFDGDLPFHIDDVRFRMLGPKEHLRAQRFADDYDTSAANKSETTKGAGNAVAVNVSHWIGGQVFEVLT
ncbi:DNA cytosine methyltransferase [Leucobacter sp. HY1908]